MAGTWSSRLLILLVALSGLIGFSQSVSLSLCSSENTSDGDAETSTYQSNGNCGNVCSGYAFSITQGKQCWCSNYAPAETVSLSECDEECPGYPYEYCGSTSGLYGYVRLSAEISGTIGSASSTSTTEAAASSQAATTPTTTATSTAESTTSSTTSTTHSTTSSAAAQTVTGSPVTSIVTLAGQTKVSTIIVTPSSSATSDSSPLGQGASNDSSSNGLSKGAVAGIAVGVALGVTMIAVIILLFLWRRMKKRRAEAEAGTGPEAVGGAGGSPNSVSRHTSQMSQSGLLSKAPRLNTRIASNGLQSSGQSGSTISPTGTTNRRSIGADQRLDAYHPIYTHENLQHSDVSLQDNMDYSRKILAVRNPGPEDE